jgi:hypothetical protein
MEGMRAVVPLLHYDSVMSVSMSYRLVQELSCFGYQGNRRPGRVADVTPSRFQYILTRNLCDAVPSCALSCFCIELITGIGQHVYSSQ